MNATDDPARGATAVSPVVPDARHPLAESIQTAAPPAAGTRPDAIQAEAPPAPAVPEAPRRRQLKRSLLLGAAALFGAYLLAAFLGLVPLSYSSIRLAGRKLVVVSNSPSVMLTATRETARVETGGQIVVVDENVVDLGSGRTMRIPDWCSEVRVWASRGRVSVTFSAD
jgi:hypothetical protein